MESSGTRGPSWVGLFLTPYLLSNLGQEGFGLWALANLLIGYLSLADLGIQSSLVRHIAHSRPDEQPVEFSRIISTSFFFYLGAAVLFAPVSLWAGPALRSEEHTSELQSH